MKAWKPGMFVGLMVVGLFVGANPAGAIEPVDRDVLDTEGCSYEVEGISAAVGPMFPACEAQFAAALFIAALKDGTTEPQNSTSTECWTGHGRADAYGPGPRSASASSGGTWNSGSGDDAATMHTWAYSNGGWGGHASATSGNSHSEC